MKMKRLLISFILFFILQITSVAQIVGTIDTLQFQFNNQELAVYVWKHSQHNDSISSKVIYLNDGQMLFDTTNSWNKQAWQIDETLELLISEKQIDQYIVVAIPNLGKRRDACYIPQDLLDYVSDTAATLLVEQQMLGAPLANEYVLFLANTIIPFINTHYLTSGNSENIIGGSSKGALIALYALTKFPDLFGGALCFSTHWPILMTDTSRTYAIGFLKYLSANCYKLKGNKIYFDHGTIGLDAQYEKFQLEANQILKRCSIKSTQFFYHIAPGAEHNEAAWNLRFKYGLLKLLQLKVE